MAYRPYPNRERALKQLDRHYPPLKLQSSEFQLHLAEQARAAMERAGQVAGPFVRNFREGLTRWAEAQASGTYVLSTRRPGTVSAAE
jgi:hypothetical protein